MAKDVTQLGLRTKLSHLGRADKTQHGFVNPPLLRGSTVLYPTVVERKRIAGMRGQRVMSYGTAGSATHWALEDVIAEIEGGTHCTIVSTGLAAVTTPLLAFLKAGDHMLMPDSVYGPARAFAEGMLTRFGVETTFYNPVIDGPGLAKLMRPNTAVVYTESPGSHTFEVQDVPALARVAHAAEAPGKIKVMMDNTWGIHHFQPFKHGVDVSIQAATKYPAGHSDILIGSITVNSEADWQTLIAGSRSLGQYASPDDCWLTLRGLRTMGVRLAQQEQSAIEVAQWLQTRSEVARVLHPALPGAPGHEIWKRDFTGACGLFSIVLKPAPQKAVDALLNAVRLFGMGYSWGGFESLIIPFDCDGYRTATSWAPGGPALRLHIGLENVGDLKADLERGFAAFNAA